MLKINDIDLNKLNFLNESFKYDPFWGYLRTKLKPEKSYCFVAFVFNLITKYNKNAYNIYATSNKLEGVMVVTDLSLKNCNQQGFLYLFKYLYTMCGLSNSLFLLLLFIWDDIKYAVMLSKNTVKLEIIAVNSDYQSKGHGTAMLKYLVEICDKDNKNILLETATEKNVMFYKKFGFILKSKSKFNIDSVAFYMLRNYKK